MDSLFLLAVIAMAGYALAQSDYPNCTVRVIAPTAPAGGNDTVGRVIAQGLTERWGRQAVVDNRAGAEHYDRRGNGRQGAA